MLKLAGEFIEGQLADHLAELDAHTKDEAEILRIGDYYHSLRWGTPSTGIYSINKIHALPFVVARKITLDRIAIEITTLLNPSNIRLGIYNNGTNLYPGSLLLDAGVVSGATTGVKAIIINQALTKGIYWLTYVADASPTVRAVANALWTPLGIGNATSFAGAAVAHEATHTYGVLLDPFPTAGADILGNCPLIGVRIASLG